MELKYPKSEQKSELYEINTNILTTSYMKRNTINLFLTLTNLKIQPKEVVNITLKDYNLPKILQNGSNVLSDRHYDNINW